MSVRIIFCRSLGISGGVCVIRVEESCKIKSSEFVCTAEYGQDTK